MTGAAQQATLVRDTDGSARLFTPFNKGFVAVLKEQIAAPWRRWDATDKCWVISAPAIAQACAIARLFYGAVEEIVATPIPKTGAPTPYAVLYLTDDAPGELVPVIYKALAKLHHPDAGGDVRHMQLINEAYERIQKMVQ